jgi:hypothetical protein
MKKLLTLMLVLNALLTSVKATDTWTDWEPVYHYGQLVGYERNRHFNEGDHGVWEIQSKNVTKNPLRVTYNFFVTSTGKRTLEGDVIIPPGETRGSWHRGPIPPDGVVQWETDYSSNN